MGSDDPKNRRSYAAPPGVVLGGIFVLGLGMGVVLTLLAASAVPDRDPVLETKPQLLRRGSAASSAPSIMRPDFWIETISDLPGPRIFVVSSPPSLSSVYNRMIGTSVQCLAGRTVLMSWRNGQLHNLLSHEECEHLKSLGVMTGMEKARAVCVPVACFPCRLLFRVFRMPTSRRRVG